MESLSSTEEERKIEAREFMREFTASLEGPGTESASTSGSSL